MADGALGKPGTCLIACTRPTTAAWATTTRAAVVQSEELQQLVVAADAPKGNSSAVAFSSFVLISSNSVTGATVSACGGEL